VEDCGLRPALGKERETEREREREREKRVGGVPHLPGKLKALSSNPSTTKSINQSMHKLIHKGLINLPLQSGLFLVTCLTNRMPMT
jgi:hypothetical protein